MAEVFLSGIMPFKCGFCGFVYEEIERAEECELRCVTRALASAERAAVNNLSYVSAQ
jgi:hypothetical protein